MVARALLLAAALFGSCTFLAGCGEADDDDLHTAMVDCARQVLGETSVGQTPGDEAEADVDKVGACTENKNSAFDCGGFDSQTHTRNCTLSGRDFGFNVIEVMEKAVPDR